MRPGERGTRRLAREYLDRLVCVRYRYNSAGDERITTIELIVDRSFIRKRHDTIVSFKIRPHETALRQQVLLRGAQYDARTRLWRLPRHEVLALGLRHRIAISVEQLIREEMASNRNEFPDMAK